MELLEISALLLLLLTALLAGGVWIGIALMATGYVSMQFVAGNIPGVTQTIPTAIYTYTQVPGGETAALRLTAIAIAIAFAALLLSELITRRFGRRILGR